MAYQRRRDGNTVDIKMCTKSVERDNWSIGAIKGRKAGKTRGKKIKRWKKCEKRAT